MLRYRDYFTKDTPELLKLLESGSHGLTGEAVAKKLSRYGSNEVARQKPNWPRLLVRQGNSFFVYLLLAALLINLIIGEWIDGGIIGAFILIYVLAGFFQEYHAEKAIFNLQKFLLRYARAHRDGEIKRVSIQELVPGDLVLLKAGDLIPADIRFIYSRGLLVDESTLTGESIPVAKQGLSISDQEVTDDLQAANLGFFGSTVVSGWARALVVATGQNTYFAEVFAKIAQIERPSIFEKNIRGVAKFLSNLILVFAALIWLTKIIILHHLDVNFLVFLVAVVVAVVPEALPLVVTLAFSRESLKLAKQGVVVKRLTSLEDLGHINVICTDKTGTITKNELTLVHFQGAEERQLLRYALIGLFGGEREHGKVYNPFDKAVLAKAGKDLIAEARHLNFLDALPFDPVRRSNSVLYQDNGKTFILNRGAPESILDGSTSYLTVAGLARPLDDNYKKETLAWFRARGRAGERVLAISFKEAKAGIKKIPSEANAEMVLAGLVSFVDPLKDTAAAALTLLRELGIQHKIITGDAPEVAGAVGRELGLIKHPDEVLSGAEFDRLNSQDQIKAVKKYQVFARTLPLHKYKIIEALRHNSAVGFLGEGLNDVPALKIADLALVVDNASDMARNVSDIVLLKRDLLVIAQAIEAGRKIFLNVIKYVRTTLAANIGNFLTLTFASFVLPFLPILPIQMLLVNLITDLPMIAISLDKVRREEAAKPQRYDLRYLYFFVIVFGLVSVPFDFIFFRSFFKFGPFLLQTSWFFYSILQEIFAFLSLRSALPIFKSGLPARSLSAFSAWAAALGLFLIFYPPLGKIFHFQALGWQQLGLIVLILLGYLVVNEMVKMLYTRFLTIKK